MSNEQLTSSVAFPESAQPPTPTAGFVQYSDTADRFSWVGTDGFVRTFAGTLSANRVYTLPDQSLTVGSGGGVWGGITGTLSNQTDLQTALSALVPKTTTVNGHALSGNVSVTPSDLSLVIGTNIEAWSANLDTWSGKTPYAGNLVVTTGKTLTVNNSIALSGTDGTTMTFPATSATIARTDAANTFTGHQTIEGVTSTGATGTGNLVFATSPSLTTPNIGAATGTGLTLSTFTTAGIVTNNGSGVFASLSNNSSPSATLLAILGSGSASSSTFLRGDGTWAAAGAGSSANPSATIGLTAVNGSATTFMTSDSAPALSQAIAPTWTGVHTFSPAARSSGTASYLTINVPADTGITASTECVGINVVGATRTWADGTVVKQEEYKFGAPTYNKTTSSATFTDAYTFAIGGPPLAGSGVTITHAHSLGIFDTTTATSPLIGAVVIGTGTTATSTAIGGGSINTGGTISCNGQLYSVLSSAGSFNALKLQNSSGSGAASSTLATLYNGTNTLSIGYTSTGFSGSLITGAPTGEQAAIWTSAAFALSLGTNATAALVIGSTQILQFASANSFAATGTGAISLGSTAPAGANSTPQEYLTFKNASGTTRYVPCY